MTLDEEIDEMDSNSNENQNESPINGFLQQSEKSYLVSNNSTNERFSQNSFTTSRHSSMMIPEFVTEDSRLELRRRKKSMEIQNQESNMTSSLPDSENDKLFVAFPTSSVVTFNTTPRNSVSFDIPDHTNETIKTTSFEDNELKERRKSADSFENKHRYNKNIKIKYNFTNDIYKSVHEEYIAKVSKYRQKRPDWNMQDKNVKADTFIRPPRRRDSHSTLPRNVTEDVSPSKSAGKRGVSESTFERRKAYEEQIRKRPIQKPKSSQSVKKQPLSLQKRTITFANDDRDVIKELDPATHEMRYQDFLKEVQNYYSVKKISNPLKQKPLVSHKKVLGLQDDDDLNESAIQKASKKSKPYGVLSYLMCCRKNMNKVEQEATEEHTRDEEDGTPNDVDSFQKMMEAHENLNRKLAQSLRASVAFESQSEYQKRTQVNKGQTTVDAEEIFKDFKILLERHNNITSRFIIKNNE